MKRACIYNKYMQGLGGGERSTFAYARALQSLGYEVEIVSSNPLPELNRIEETFGPEFSGIAMRFVEEGAMHNSFRSDPPSLFVNHSFQDFTPSLGDIGIYSQMFPTVRVASGNRKKDVKALQTYQLLLNNSSFTKQYTDLLWEYPIERSHVLHPPIGEDMIATAKTVRKQVPIKEKLIIGIGRFNVFPANKNQKIIIQAFLDAQAKCSELEEWKLVLIGNQNPDPASEEYYGECLDLVRQSSADIEILSELSHQELKDLLAQAFGYVHAAGAFHLPGEEPYKCEHLGLSIAEGMANGCIPLLYARGGIYDILDPAKAGIPYISYDGLVEGFMELADLWGEPNIGEMQSDLAEMADKLSFEHFTTRLGQLLSEEISR